MASGHPALGHEGRHHFLCLLAEGLGLDRHLVALMAGKVIDLGTCEEGVYWGRKGMTFVLSFKSLF